MRADFLFEWLFLWFIMQIIIFSVIDGGETCEEFNWAVSATISLPLSIVFFIMVF